MIDPERTPRAQQTTVVAIGIAIALTLTAGALGMAGNDATRGIIPGTDSLDAGETTGPDVTGADEATVREGTPTVTPEPNTPTRESVTPTPAPATPTPKQATQRPGSTTPTPEPTASTSASVTSTSATEAAPETALHLDPVNDGVRPGRTTTYDVVVGSAHGGVGGAELALVVGDPSVATITEVTVLGSGEQAVDMAEDGSRVDINYTARDTYDAGSFSILEVTVEGRAHGETSLSFGAASSNENLFLFDEQGTGYDVTDTAGATVTVASGGGSAPESASESPAEDIDAFQLDLVEGEVLPQLDPDAGDTYHKQDRFITALHVTEDERRWGGPGSPMGRTYRSNGCEVAYGHLSFHPDTGVSKVAVTVTDVGGCAGITLSYAGYELPDGTTGWDGDRAHEQDLKDSATVTLHPGEEEILTIDVMVGTDEQRAG